MDIKILNRTKMEQMASSTFISGISVISCFDFEDEPVEFLNMPKNLLRLEFDDVSLWDFADFNGNLPSENELAILRKKHHMFTEKLAQEVATFYKQVRNTTEVLICQCEHGESRSAAIAAAIMQYENKNAIEIFADERYIPNKTVYKLALEALNS